ncbi:MAG: NDP-sugar synthase [Chloroflexi bacterium]|nr:NDP-sugar synthase [Chloroflexota bacterium]
MARLHEHSVDTIILTLCYLPESIQSYFGDGSRFGVNMVYIEEKVALGTAGAVKNAGAHFDDGPFFVLNGDVLSDLDFSALMRAHRKHGGAATLALRAVEDVSMFGVVETAPDGRILRFVEKPKPGQVSTNMINAGTYILDPALLRYIPANTSFSFEKQFFPLVLSSGERLFGIPTSGYWIDMGKPDKYLELNRSLLSKRWQENDRRVIMEAASVDQTAVIEGPAMIGDGSIIEAGVTIKGPSVIGRSCHIGRGSRLEGVILWNGVRVGNNSVLKDCIVASNCLVNDNCCIGEGCVVGDGCTVIPDCVIKPGSQVWPGTLVT